MCYNKRAMDIIIGGPVGYETALKLYKANQEILDGRFPEFYVRQFLELRAGAEVPCCGTPIKEGGLFAALWQLCEEKNCGCVIDIRKVPIYQEVIEICELFDVNPYEAESEGAWIAATDKAALEEPGYKIIGKTSNDKARIVLLGDDEKNGGRFQRFLTPPKRQAKDLANR